MCCYGLNYMITYMAAVPFDNNIFMKQCNITGIIIGLNKTK